MNLSAVILAGGESRRMGCDKTWLEFEGQSLLARDVSVVRELGVAEVFISGRVGEDYSALGCPVLFDLEPGFGPLGGIERGLHAAASSLLLVLAVDLPRMTAAFLRKLLAKCDLQIGVVAKLEGRLEPLVAIYPKRCHAIAVDLILRSRHAARDFAESCAREHAVRILTVTRPDADCLANWNTPADVSGTWPIGKAFRAVPKVA